MSTSTLSTSPIHVTKDNISNLNYYEIFHLSENEESIDTNELRRAYRRYTLLFHPDKDASSEAREAFEKVVLAVETLTDEVKRGEYDASLRKTSTIGNRNNKSRCETNKSDEQTYWQDADNDVERESNKRQAREEKATAMAAEDVLRQREMASRMEKEEAIRLTQLKELAANRMREELTSALHTPFKIMEESLIQEWGIDEELLSVKRKEICALLADLDAATCENVHENFVHSRHNKRVHHTSSKRAR